MPDIWAKQSVACFSKHARSCSSVLVQCKWWGFLNKGHEEWSRFQNRLHRTDFCSISFKTEMFSSISSAQIWTWRTEFVLATLESPPECSVCKLWMLFYTTSLFSFHFASRNFDGVPYCDHHTRSLRSKWPLWTFTVRGLLLQCWDARPKGTPFCPLVERQRLHWVCCACLWVLTCSPEPWKQQLCWRGKGRLGPVATVTHGRPAVPLDTAVHRRQEVTGSSISELTVRIFGSEEHRVFLF